jgi:hypothetical protein
MKYLIWKISHSVVKIRERKSLGKSHETNTHRMSVKVKGIHHYEPCIQHNVVYSK